MSKVVLFDLVRNHGFSHFSLEEVCLSAQKIGQIRFANGLQILAGFCSNGDGVHVNSQGDLVGVNDRSIDERPNEILIHLKQDLLRVRIFCFAVIPVVWGAMSLLVFIWPPQKLRSLDVSSAFANHDDKVKFDRSLREAAGSSSSSAIAHLVSLLY